MAHVLELGRNLQKSHLQSRTKNLENSHCEQPSQAVCQLRPQSYAHCVFHKRFCNRRIGKIHQYYVYIHRQIVGESKRLRSYFMRKPIFGLSINDNYFSEVNYLHYIVCYGRIQFVNALASKKKTKDILFQNYIFLSKRNMDY